MTHLNLTDDHDSRHSTGGINLVQLESYTVISKGTVCSMSDNHTDLLLNGLVPIGTFARTTAYRHASPARNSAALSRRELYL